MQWLSLALASSLATLLSASASQPGIGFGYYKETCPAAEQIVFRETTRIVRASPDLAASLLRLHYHDCFVQGCDASVLLDSTDGTPAEKDAKPNESLRGFDAVARVKDKLEKACPATVSCADLLALMARDAVVLVRDGDLYLNYRVPTLSF
jgi:peroxidase